MSVLVANRHTFAWLLSKQCRPVLLGSWSTFTPKNQPHFTATKQLLNEFQAGILQTKKFLNAGGKCTVNKYKQSFIMAASCVPTGIKHQSGNTVKNSAGSSSHYGTRGRADASHISEQTRMMPSWRSN